MGTDDESFLVRVPTGAMSQQWVRLSLWITGGVFSILAAIVLARRPDTVVARRFALFAFLASIALGVSPAAGGPHPAWSIIVQFLSLLALAASMPAFALVYVGDQEPRRTGLRFFWLAGCIILLGYLASFSINPSFYAKVRVAFALYLASGILAAIVILARKVLVGRRRHTARDARLALGGIACGTLPFVGLTLIPQATVNKSLVPEHLTAMLWIAIPLTFAYAILRHQVLGIRRLMHRGMVHGITAAALLLIMCLLVAVTDSLVSSFFSSRNAVLVTAVLLTLGIPLFHFLRRGVRSLADRYFYLAVDSRTLLEGMQYDIFGSEREEEVVAAMVKRLRDSLRLESIVLFLSATSETMRVAASAGARAVESVGFVQPRLPGWGFGENGLSEMRWNSDVLIIARLGTEKDTLGFLVLGPKERGEVFLQEEWRLIETVTPIIVLAIRETVLLAELREVSDQLTQAQEAERARMARDLHDGPLQKAVLLGGAPGAMLRDPSGLARELAAELRELCARLRPAILDDLGLVPALEWLLEQTGQGFMVTSHLTLRGIAEGERLAPNTELALFRVTQEAVNNALKHGHAKSIHVSLSRTIEGIQLSVADDGSGLKTSRDIRYGLGIRGMRERLRQLGGEVAIISNKKTGTLVKACIPCSTEMVQ